MTSIDAISVDLGKLKREVEEFNYHHRDNKIKYTPIVRKAVQEELNKRRTEELLSR